MQLKAGQKMGWSKLFLVLFASTAKLFCANIYWMDGWMDELVAWIQVTHGASNHI